MKTSLFLQRNPCIPPSTIGFSTKRFRSPSIRPKPSTPPSTRSSPLLAIPWSCLALEKHSTAARTFLNSATGSSSAWWRRMATAPLPSRAVSSRARVVNEYVAGRGAASYEAVQDTGFSHGFGRLDANRELVEWMRRYNTDPSHRVKLQFYGFDSPTEMTCTDSPSQVLHFVLDYLASVGAAVT